MLIGQTIAFVQSFFLNLGFSLSLVITIVCFLPVLLAWPYLLDEFLRIEHESAPLFKAARAMIVGGFAVCLGIGTLDWVGRMVVRAFSLTLPYPSTLRVIRDSLFLIGIFSIGIGALMVKGKGPLPQPEEVEHKARERKWTMGVAVSIIGLITGLAGFYGGVILPLPGLVLLSSGAVVFLIGLLVMKRRPRK